MFKRKVTLIIFCIIIAFLVLAGKFLQKIYVPPILMYHYVYDGANPGDPLVVTPAAFERQMHFLKKYRYNVVPLNELTELIREKGKIPGRTVALTFDDGFKNNYTNAFPILRKYNFPATMFIITDEVNRPQGDKMTWGEMRIMQASGMIDFGSHTLGPQPLVNIKSQEELKRQIFDSKKVLEEKLGREVATFSYPEGMFDQNIKQLVIDAGYKAAVATKPGRKSANDDLFALKRVRISQKADNLFIFWFESSGFYTFFKEGRGGHKK